MENYGACDRTLGTVSVSLREFLSVAIVPRCKNDCTWVRARGNQLIHRTMVREHAALHPYPAVLILLMSSSSASSSATIRVHFVGVHALFLSPLSLLYARTRAPRILVEIESGEAEPSRASRGSISFYMRVECPATYADTTRR